MPNNFPESSNIVTICFGKNYYDPATSLAIYHVIKKCQEQQVPVIYCTEIPENGVLATEFVKTSRYIENLLKLIERYSLEHFFKTPEKKLLPFFDLNQKEQLIDQLELLIKKPIDYDILADELISIHSLVATEKILSYLMKHQIPYVPIDIKDQGKLYNAALNTSTNEEQLDVILQSEERRISTMTKNIFEKGIKPLKNTGGVILCDVGAFNAPKLAANLSSKFAIKTTAVYCHSSYCTSLGDMLKRGEKPFKSQHPMIPFHFQFNGSRMVVNKPFSDLITSRMQCFRKPPQMAAALLFGLFCYNGIPKSTPDCGRSNSPG